MIIFSLAYLWCGWQTLTGSTASTIRPGIWSVFFGIVWGAVAVMDAQSKVNVPNGPLVFLFLAALSGSLLLAGFLAIKGSPSYKQWRRANRLYD